MIFGKLLGGITYTKPLLVGLGNPGAEYNKTRHNIGFMLCDIMGSDFARARKGRYRYSVNPDFSVFKPMTFMNNSGLAVKKIIAQSDASLSDMLVICDDFHLPLGKIRLRKSGSAGGHNGLKSLIEALGSSEFPRLRMGIGEVESMDARDYVLQEFSRAEEPLMGKMLERARDCVYSFIREGVDTAMNKFN